MSVFAANSFEWNKAIRVLLRFSLLQRTDNAHILSIHRLVQVVLKDQMDHPTQRRWAEGALQAVNHVFPQVEFEVWSRCERYLPHAQVCAELIEMWKLESLEAARLLHEAGYYLEERARYGRAEQLLLQSKKLYERVYTSHHSTVAQSLENYVTFLRRRNRKQKAAKLQARVQAIRTRLAHETKEDMA